jgi:hypothetical protein
MPRPKRKFEYVIESFDYTWVSREKRWRPWWDSGVRYHHFKPAKARTFRQALKLAMSCPDPTVMIYRFRLNRSGRTYKDTRCWDIAHHPYSRPTEE